MVGHNRVSDGIQITRTAKELAYNPSFMGGVLGAPNTREYIETLGKDAENVFGTDSFSPALNAPGLPAVVERVKRQDEPASWTSASQRSWRTSPSYGTRSSARRTADPRALRDAIASTSLNTGDRNFFHVARREVQRQGRQRKGRRHHHPDPERPGCSGLAGRVCESAGRISKAGMELIGDVLASRE